MEENAKAVQQIAKTTRKGFDLGEKLGSFLSTIFGEGLKYLGGTFSDWTKYFRYKNFLNLKDKVQAIHEKREVVGKTIPIPPRYAIPLLEAASTEDDETIQDMWAGLIASATDPSTSFQLQKIYIQIISNLEPFDALLLEFLDEQNRKNMEDNKSKSKLNSEYISTHFGKKREVINISLSNLFRLGCIIDVWENYWDSEKPNPFQGFRVNNSISDFRLSQLGKMLMQACKTE